MPARKARRAPLWLRIVVGSIYARLFQRGLRYTFGGSRWDPTRRRKLMRDWALLMGAYAADVAAARVFGRVMFWQWSLFELYQHHLPCLAAGGGIWAHDRIMCELRPGRPRNQSFDKGRDYVVASFVTCVNEAMYCFIPDGSGRWAVLLRKLVGFVTIVRVFIAELRWFASFAHSEITRPIAEGEPVDAEIGEVVIACFALWSAYLHGFYLLTGYLRPALRWVLARGGKL